ncbi:MAG: hypothetical protein RCO49_09150 [Rickettsia endosymbiont of Argas persicus]
MFIELYNRINDKLHFWQVWDNEQKTKLIVSYGIVGIEGKYDEFDVSPQLYEDIGNKIEQLAQEGYKPIDIDDHAILIVEYNVTGDFGTEEDLEKRHKLQDLLGEILGWTGLGKCDGGSVGGGTMEACCYVVDFDIAKKIIKEKLKGTEFEDYTRIYNEIEDSEDEELK